MLRTGLVIWSKIFDRLVFIYLAIRFRHNGPASFQMLFFHKSFVHKDYGKINKNVKMQLLLIKWEGAPPLVQSSINFKLSWWKKRKLKSCFAKQLIKNLIDDRTGGSAPSSDIGHPLKEKR